MDIDIDGLGAQTNAVYITKMEFKLLLCYYSVVYSGS